MVKVCGWWKKIKSDHALTITKVKGCAKLINT